MEKGIAEFIKLYKAQHDSITNDATGRVSNALVRRTPVDEGDTVADWDVSINKGPPDTKPPPFDPKRSLTRRRLRELIKSVKFGDWVMFENTNEAALFLEFGSSDQAPTGIVRTVARRWPAFVKGAARAAQNRIKKQMVID